jgi:hypothetical protein
VRGGATAVVALTVAGAVGLAAAGPAGAAGTRPVPSAKQLRAALLTTADTGLHASGPSTGGGGGGAGAAAAAVDVGVGTEATGCAALDKALDTPVGPRSQETDLNGGDTGPLLSELLVAGPQAREATTYRQIKSALATCHKMNVSDGSTPIALRLTPIRLGGAESTAARMDGTFHGVPINGYIAFGQVGPVLIDYLYFQFGDASSQHASAMYRKAVDKVRHVVAGTKPGTPTNPPATTKPGVPV